MALVANITLVALSLLMGLRLLQQYRGRPHPHTLWYGVGLVLAAVASFPEVFRGITGSLPTFLWWTYWVAASALVGYLSVGTAYLLSPKAGKVALVSATVLTAALLVATVATAGPAPTIFTDATFAKAPNAFIKTPFLIQNIAGALLIFGGAAWTFFRIRAWFAVWIALGTLLFTIGGTSSGIFKSPALFYFTQMAGIIVLYFGITQSTRPRQKKQAAA